MTRKLAVGSSYTLRDTKEQNLRVVGLVQWTYSSASRKCQANSNAFTCSMIALSQRGLRGMTFHFCYRDTSFFGTTGGDQYLHITFFRFDRIFLPHCKYGKLV